MASALTLPDGGIAGVTGGPLVQARPATADGRASRAGLLLWSRAFLVLAATIVAFHYSLLTLMRSVALDTPLAYLGLVPPIALALAVIAGRRWRWEPDVNDRYVDYIVGVPLLLLTLTVMLVGPVVMSSFFWRWRLDLLMLPVFAAGAVVVVFGLRSALRIKVALAFLFLAWPLPYTLLLSQLLQAFTDTTIGALRALVAVVPVARPLDGADPSLFLVPDGGEGFLVSVGSACGGVNGSLGFLLIGSAIAAVARGGLLRKQYWLANGMVLTLALNLARILAIFAAGNRWGQAFAIEALHPVIGLVAFNVAVVAMVLALPAFGLRLGPPSEGQARRPRDPDGAGLPRVSARLPVQRAAIALAIVFASSVLAGSADAGLRAFQPTASDLGQPRLSEWDATVASVPGWSIRLTSHYPWVEQYFGSGATWTRYAYVATATPVLVTSGGPPKPVFVNLDVISTWDLGTFSTYGLEACYGFHNYAILETDRVDLGQGVVGHAVAYFNPSTRTGWTAMYWEWPVLAGDRERYERIILNVPTLSGELPAPAPPSGDAFAEFRLALASLFGGPSVRSADPDLAAVRTFLVGFARELVLTRADHPGTASASLGAAP